MPSIIEPRPRPGPRPRDDPDLNERLDALFDEAVGDGDFATDAMEVRTGVERAEADAERLLDAAEAEAVAAAGVVAIDVRADPRSCSRFGRGGIPEVRGVGRFDFIAPVVFRVELAACVETDIEAGLFAPGESGNGDCLGARVIHDRRSVSSTGALDLPQVSHAAQFPRLRGTTGTWRRRDGESND